MSPSSATPPGASGAGERRGEGEPPPRRTLPRLRGEVSSRAPCRCIGSYCRRGRLQLQPDPLGNGLARALLTAGAVPDRQRHAVALAGGKLKINGFWRSESARPDPRPAAVLPAAAPGDDLLLFGGDGARPFGHNVFHGAVARVGPAQVAAGARRGEGGVVFERVHIRAGR